MHEWYAAPMEGLTGWRWRQVQHEMFGGAALYVTPFVSPNGNFSFQRKELEEMDPERNRGIPVVPQILTNRAEYFVWAAKECRSRGWEQVDLNLGCPSGTVTGKNKGAGLLRQPELLRQLLDGIFDALPDMKISVKTRIGWERAEEWPALLALLETYPICRLTVHPRVRTQFYKGTADREVFRWTAEHTALPLCYNGDVTTVRDLREMGETFPDDAVMVGRGLVADPSLLRQATGGPAASLEELREFHDRLYGLTAGIFPATCRCCTICGSCGTISPGPSGRRTPCCGRCVRLGTAGHMRRRCGSFSMTQSCPIDNICKGIILYTKNPRFP